MKMEKVASRNLLLDLETYTGLVLVTILVDDLGKGMNIKGNKVF